MVRSEEHAVTRRDRGNFAANAKQIQPMIDDNSTPTNYDRALKDISARMPSDAMVIGRAPVPQMVLNNGGIGGGVAEFPEDRGQLPPRVLTIGARYDKTMEAFGGRGWYIEDPKDLRGALDEAIAFKGPALVNVRLHHAAGRKPQQFGWHKS